MGTASVRSGSHPVLLATVATRSVQVTVIVAGVVFGVAPSPSARSAALPSLRSALPANPAAAAPFIGRVLAGPASCWLVRECCHLAAPAFTFPMPVRAFYRSPEGSNIYQPGRRKQVFWDPTVHRLCTGFINKLFIKAVR